MSTPIRWNLLRERLFSPLGFHVVAFALLALVALGLAIRVGLDWRTTSAGSQDALIGARAQLRAMDAQTAPLRGLDKRVDLSRTQIDTFYAKRVPPSYSAILEQIGKIQATGPVRLTRVQYTQVPGSGDLTEIRMDAGLSGDYPAILRVINGLERSQTFFIIRAMALTGQQSGVVNLRLQFSAWLKPADVPGDNPLESATPTQSNPTQSTTDKEGN